VQVTQLPIDSLVPYARNARTHSPEQVAAIAASIREFGFNNPVLLRDDDTIIAGHGRVLAARKLGLAEVPCIYLSHLTDIQARAYVLADNQLATHAGWDADMLGLELDFLTQNDIDPDLLGFGEAELADLLGKDAKVDVVENDVPEPPADPITKSGDLWLLGDHRLLCGDAADPRDIARLLAGETPGLTVVDPPFEMPDSVWSVWIDDPSIVFGQMRQMRMIPAKWWRFERVIVKRYRHRSASVQIDHRHAFVAQVGSDRVVPHTSETFPSVLEQEADIEHDHQKPLKLLVEHMTRWTPPWDMVLDPFLGSGTTLIAAEQLGRKCYGMEISPQYCDVIVARWEALTGKKAELSNV